MSVQSTSIPLFQSVRSRVVFRVAGGSMRGKTGHHLFPSGCSCTTLGTPLLHSFSDWTVGTPVRKSNRRLARDTQYYCVLRYFLRIRVAYQAVSEMSQTTVMQSDSTWSFYRSTYSVLVSGYRLHVSTCRWPGLTGHVPLCQLTAMAEYCFVYQQNWVSCLL